MFIEDEELRNLYKVIAVEFSLADYLYDTRQSRSFVKLGELAFF